MCGKEGKGWKLVKYSVPESLTSYLIWHTPSQFKIFSQRAWSSGFVVQMSIYKLREFVEKGINISFSAYFMFVIAPSFYSELYCVVIYNFWKLLEAFEFFFCHRKSLWFQWMSTSYPCHLVGWLGRSLLAVRLLAKRMLKWWKYQPLFQSLGV